MNLILIEEEFSETELAIIKKEFPRFEISFVRNLQEQLPSFSQDILQGTQILFCQNFSWEIGESMPHLRWVHTMNPPFRKPNYFLKSQPRFITCGFDLDAHALSELIWATLLYYSKGVKQLLNQEEICFKEHKTFLQMGLGPLGSELCKLAQRFHMKTWGIHESGSFHPNCTKTFSNEALHSLLPHTDILSISPFGQSISSPRLRQEIFKLLPKGALLTITGIPAPLIFEDMDWDEFPWDHFGGVVLFSPTALEHETKKRLETIENLTIIPSDIRHKIQGSKRSSFLQFRDNLRLYNRGHHHKMRGIFYAHPT